MSTLYKVYSPAEESSITQMVGNKIVLKPNMFMNRKVLAISANTSLNNIVPEGYMLENIVVVNKTSHAVSITAGTATGTTDVISTTEVGANIIYTFLIGKIFSFTDKKTLYIKSADWNSASVDIYVIMRKPSAFKKFTKTTLL